MFLILTLRLIVLLKNAALYSATKTLLERNLGIMLNKTGAVNLV